LVLARVRTYQRLKSLSDTMRSAVKMDFLTGAVTRREFEKTMTQEWLRAQRSSAPLALLVADIEGFTAYNTEYGEEKGDACLKSVADSLRSAAHGPSDLLGRYAGGKFALLLPGTDARGAHAIARRAIDAVNDLDIPQAALMGSGRLTLSVGVGYRDSAAGADPRDLITAAEQALKCVRNSGAPESTSVNVADLGISR
jgi:diguanylate cyclase (GGDEF)-like protein